MPDGQASHQAEVDALRDVVVTLRVNRALRLNCFPQCFELQGSRREECQNGNVPQPALDGEFEVAIHNRGERDVTIPDFGTDAVLFVDAVSGEPDVPMTPEVDGPHSVVVGAGKTASTWVRYDGSHGEFIRPGRYRVSYRIRANAGLPELPIGSRDRGAGPDKRVDMERRRKVILDPSTWSGQSKAVDVVIPRPAWCSQANSPWLATTMFADEFRQTCAVPDPKKK